MKIKIFILILMISQFSFSQNFKFGKVSKEELEQKEHPKTPSANAAVLYRSFNTHFDYSQELGFYLETDVFERIKIYNKEGFDYGTKEIRLYQGKGNHKESVFGVKAYTYYLDENRKVEKIKLKKEGVFEEKVSKTNLLKKITMPNLNEGCIIEYKYTIKSPFTYNIDSYRFQETIPVNEVSLVFKVPEYLMYKTHQKGWLNFKINKGGKDRKIEYSYIQKGVTNGGGLDKTIKNEITFRENSYTVNMHDVPAVIEEAYSGNINNYLSSLKFELSYTKYPNSPTKSYASNWDFVAKSIYESQEFGGQLEKIKYFKSDIDNLLSGVSNPNEKMARIFDFVKNKMTWNKYNGKFVFEGVKDAYKKGTGNTAEINLMLTAMFRYAKLNANPILVSTKNNGIPIMATRNGFNYVISGVEVKNAVYLFDATNKNSEVNILKPNLLNWQGRLIREEGSSTWVPLIPTKLAVKDVMISASIEDGLLVKGKLQKRQTGHYSQHARNKYENMSADDVRKELEKEKGETEISDIEFTNLDVLNKPVGLKYNFESADIVEDISGKLYFSPMLFIGEKENPFKMEDRKYPIDFSFPKKDRITVNIKIPEGYKVESLPKNTSFSFGENGGSFKYLISETNGTVKLSVDFTINQSLISPNEYIILKGFFQLMIEKGNEKIVLSKI